MPEMLTIRTVVNGTPRTLDVAVHHTLLEVMRSQAGLTGTKECCVVGECGACTVILDGRTVNSCLILAVEAGDYWTVGGPMTAPVEAAVPTIVDRAIALIQGRVAEAA